MDRFAASHGSLTVRAVGPALVLDAADGGRARLVDRCQVGTTPEDPAPLPDAGAWLDRAIAPRTVGIVLVRRRAHAVGVAHGDDLIAHHVDTHHVQGRTKAGGWSQQRYARRRANQAGQAWESAVADVQRVISPHAARLDLILPGGDVEGLTKVLGDVRLRALADVPRLARIGVAEPRFDVLEQVAAQLRSVLVEVWDPPSA